MYRYAEFERILTLMFYIRPEYLHTFRSRLKYFRRLGMFKTNPGSGNQITYEYIDLCEWSFILELSEFGVDPSRMGKIKAAAWPECAAYFAENWTRGDEDRLFVANPVMFSNSMREADESAPGEAFGITFLGRGPHKWLYPKSGLADALGRRALVINLASIRRRLAVAIKELAPDDGHIRSQA